jgi:NitT/TauT family transport system ATP-binding protein
MLELRGVRKAYGETLAVRDLTFRIEAHELVCVVGPSGCGKTTLLRCMSGLLPVTAGEVLLHGSRVTAPPAEMALVFQEYGRSLFPWLTVRQNVLLPLRRKGLPRWRRERLVEEALGAVGLPDVSDRFPWQLSGGMQQRVAIARALAYQPEILLMDEPFASVDAQTRADLEDLLLRVWREFRVTVVFVTHDIDESIYLADRVLVLGPRPSVVREAVPVGLPRPRHQVATKALAEFGRLRAHIYTLIRSSRPADRESGPD